jgi:predicted RNase H-like HicB family nuclease
VKVSDVIKKIEGDGWVLIRTAGSHRHFKHPSKPGNKWQHIRRDAKGDPEQRAATSRFEMSGYLIVIEQDGESWGAYAPDLPGLGVAADGRAEVEQLAREAVASHLALLKELGEPIPSPTAQATYVEVA